MHNFEPDDELFFFGFSRGAYTARSTVGFVRNAGILRLENADRIDEAYALYRDRATHPRDIESQLFRRSFSRETRIRFIGVWDTVGALGIPWSGMPGIELINRRWQFHDTDLSTTVDAAFQALAIDEKRPPFEPAIWSQQPDAVGQRLEQVWFAGVHCDVGGGYPDSTLADMRHWGQAARAFLSNRTRSENSTSRAGGSTSCYQRMSGSSAARIRRMNMSHPRQSNAARRTPLMRRPVSSHTSRDLTT